MVYPPGALISRRERTHAILREPEFFEELLERVAEGGTLHQICSARMMSYMMTVEWIKVDDGRNKRYEQALTARESAFKDLVLAQLAAGATADRRRMFDALGRVITPRDMPDDIAETLQGVEVVHGPTDENGKPAWTETKVKTVDRTKNAELLGKTVAMFKDRVETTGGATLEQLLAAAASVKPPEHKDAK